MTADGALSPDERFDTLRAAAVRKGRMTELRVDMGSPETIDHARRVFRALPDFDGSRKLDRSIMELKYGDELDW
jgi:hypothetical protein